VAPVGANWILVGAKLLRGQCEMILVGL
jgi:hypothetical protein